MAKRKTKKQKAIKEKLPKRSINLQAEYAGAKKRLGGGRGVTDETIRQIAYTVLMIRRIPRAEKFFKDQVARFEILYKQRLDAGNKGVVLPNPVVWNKPGGHNRFDSESDLIAIKTTVLCVVHDIVYPGEPIIEEDLGFSRPLGEIAHSLAIGQNLGYTDESLQGCLTDLHNLSKMPADPIQKAVVLERYHVTEAQLKTLRKNGLLTIYRGFAVGKTSPIIYSESEIRRHCDPRKQK